MEQQKRRRGVQPQEEKGKKKKSGFNIFKLIYFVPFVAIVSSGILFKSVNPLFESIVVTILVVVFAISFGLSYYGAAGRSKFLKAIATLFNILLLVIFLGIGYFSIQLKQGIGAITTDTPEVKAEQVNVKKETFNVLISGTDTRDDAIDQASRSDVIMVATVNPKEGEVLLTSLPRDTYYPLTCTGTYDKLTHASQEGMSCLVDTVEEILDVQINYYLKANFYAVINLINAVGGITVDVDVSFCGQDENDIDNAYCFYPGPTYMNGAQALSYARERKSFGDGDYTRAYHQQQVMNAFMKEVMLNPGSISDLINVSASSIRTNMTSSELMELASSFTSFESTGYVVQGYGQTVDIPYRGLYGTSVQVLTDASISEAQTQIKALEDK